MNSETPLIPLPKEPRHQRFADLVLRGRPLVDAYQEAGFKCSRATANANAKKLRKRPDVESYIRAIQTTAADDTTLSVQEILQYCARVVRVPITTLDPRDTEAKNADLIKSFTINDTETGSTFRLEKHCPYKAIDTHLKLTGHDPEANVLSELAHVFANLKNSPIPEDRM